MSFALSPGGGLIALIVALIWAMVGIMVLLLLPVTLRRLRTTIQVPMKHQVVPD